MVRYFDEAAQDPTLFLSGSSPFAEKYLTRDKLWDEIFRPNPELDATTLTIAAATMKSFAAFARKQFADQIEGGIYYGISAETAKGIPKHNMALERAFGFWDRLMRKVPGMSAAAAEACTLSKQNGTISWILEKPEAERERLIQQCQQQTPQMLSKYKEREQQLQKDLQARMQLQQQEKAEKEEREMNERLALVRKVEAQGVWQSIEQMNNSLANITSKKLSIDTIKAQLSYRKKILRQSSNAKYFAFSENRRQFGQEELKSNLAVLIGEQMAGPVVEQSDERMNEWVDGIDEWMNGSTNS